MACCRAARHNDEKCESIAQYMRSRGDNFGETHNDATHRPVETVQKGAPRSKKYFSADGNFQEPARDTGRGGTFAAHKQPRRINSATPGVSMERTSCPSGVWKTRPLPYSNTNAIGWSLPVTFESRDGKHFDRRFADKTRI